MVERLKQRGLTGDRSDDNEETIRKRLKTFHECTMPVISYYQQNNKVWEVCKSSTHCEEHLMMCIINFYDNIGQC